MPGFPKHPVLYEINTRVFLKSIGKRATLKDIPHRYWKDLKKKGIDWVWLMGVWEIQEKALDPHLIPPEMMREFRELVPDLGEDDICGSPYAIHDYVIDPDIGDTDELKSLRKTLHKLGMRLMLDFVPNHFGAHCRWLHSNPEYFVEVNRETFRSDEKTYYKPYEEADRYFAHGKDPYFDAWQDTVQVNYANPAVHSWMTQTLGRIAEMCDGVRCDMAMLPVSRILNQTWGHILPQAEWMPEFWPAATTAVRNQHPDFLFLAECYWDMEAELMEMGFDYCYDKVFFDRMTDVESDRMRQHFHAEPAWLSRTARFLENHDEPRAASRLELKKHMATAALVACGPGMRFWHHGQWEGRRKKVPVQLHRSPPEAACACLLTTDESVCGCVATFYSNMLEVAGKDVFRDGDWQMIREPASPGVIVWLWKHRTTRVLLVVNYSDREVHFALPDFLHLIHMERPSELISGREVDPHAIHYLAPWCVHLWNLDPL